MEEKNINEIGAAEQHGIKKLTDYQHLRLRTETYLGARTLHEQPVILFSDLGPLIDNEGWVPALMTSFREIIDNSLDEFTKANIKGVLTVTYSEKHLAFEVRDNGRGIPLDWDANHGCHLATLVMSHLKAGRNFVDTERKGVAGMNGLGGSAITNVSSTFEISVVRTGQPNAAPTNDDLKYKGNWHFQQKFTEGNELFGDELQIHNPVVQRTTSTAVGTTIRFQLSPEVFKVRSLPTKLVESLLREIAVANPQHKITFNNSKLPTGSVEKILFPKHKCIPLHISEEGFKSTFYVVPNVDGANGLLHSLVNNIPTYDSGNHLDTFKRIFALSLIRNLEKESKRKKLKPNRGDIEEGLLIYNHTVMDGPYFQSQAKTKLINDEVIKPIERAMSDEWFQELIKKNKAWIDEIYARCMIRTSSKDADELTRAAKKNLRSKVAKLRDATEKHDRSVCSIFLAEGDCIHEDTEVYVLRDGEFQTVLAKELEIGDVVLTDKHNLKPIIGITKKVKPLALINTSAGPIRVTKEHRLYVLDNDGEFKYKKVKDIEPGVDKLVRSQIVDHKVLDSFIKIEKTTDDKYQYFLETASGHQMFCTAEHRYGVFDFEDMCFSVVEVQNLDINRHALLGK